MKAYVIKSKHHSDIVVYDCDPIGIIGFIMVELSSMDPEDEIVIECYEEEFNEKEN